MDLIIMVKTYNQIVNLELDPDPQLTPKYWIHTWYSYGDT